MQAQEHLLRDFFRQPPVAQKSPGETEDHRLVPPHQFGEIESGLGRH